MRWECMAVYSGETSGSVLIRLVNVLHKSALETIVHLLISPRATQPATVATTAAATRARVKQIVRIQRAAPTPPNSSIAASDTGDWYGAPNGAKISEKYRLSSLL